MLQRCLYCVKSLHAVRKQPCDVAKSLTILCGLLDLRGTRQTLQVTSGRMFFAAVYYHFMVARPVVSCICLDQPDLLSSRNGVI